MHTSRRFHEWFNPLLSTLDGRVERHRVNPRILVSEQQRFVFYRIPKAGHSTVGNTLLHYDPTVTDEQRAELQDAGDKIGVYLRPRDLGIRRSRVAWRDYFLFTFVRNPFHRTLSAYLDKVVRDRPPAAKNLGDSPTQDGSTIGFSEFLDKLEAGALYRGPHWAPQVSLLPKDRSRLNFIGRLERIDSDLPQLIGKLFGSDASAEVRNWDPHRTDSASKLASYYDAAAVDRVRRMFREDFEAFGYSLDPEKTTTPAE
ncbi:MAG: sulfotransferase family protein [Ectothiorhodospiraceae bacterium]|nr:sulfotransferase family protein [Ectothiorhodospiraceae bacterium]MCH8503381.1 sulfotransferase family protein [Ectothiorhodospiraceae bacterium]